MQSMTVAAGVHNPNGHTAAEVLSALRFESGSRKITYRYELLTSARVSLGDVDNVLSCSIEQNWLADVKRTSRLTVRDDGTINFLSDLIRPWARLHMAPYGDDDWVEWPLGTFMLASPKRTLDTTSVVTRDVEAYDYGQLYLSDKVEERYSISATRTVAEDFEDDQYAFAIGGTWARASDQAHSGTYSLKSADIGDYETSDANISVPAGSTSMSIWYRVSSEEFYDLFDILIDGVSYAVNASGEVPWTNVVVDVYGVSIVTLRYTKDDISSGGSDAVWVDDISFSGASALYTDAISSVLGDSVESAIVPSSAGLVTDLEWDPGTPKLKIINDLLGAISYNSLSFDELGTAVAGPYVLPSGRPAEYTYADDSASVITLPVEQEIDLFDVPNKWVLTVSRPDSPLLTSSYTNSDPASPTSTVSRQRTIVDYRQAQDIADQAALDAEVERIAFEASQVFEVIEFSTAVMPIHSGNDVYRITVSGLAVNSKYAEHSWSFALKEGERMKHRARKVVRV